MKVEFEVRSEHLVFLLFSALAVLLVGAALAVDTSAPWHPLSQIQIDTNLVMGTYDIVTDTLTANSITEGGTALSSKYAPIDHNHNELYYLKSDADSLFIDAAGDTLSGTLNLGGNDITNVGGLTTTTADVSGSATATDLSTTNITTANITVTENITLSGVTKGHWPWLNCTTPQITAGTACETICSTDYGAECIGGFDSGSYFRECENTTSVECMCCKLEWAPKA